MINENWSSIEEGQKNSLQSEIDRIDSNRLLNSSVDDLCDYFEENFRFDVPVLDENQIVVDQRETEIDVSHDQMRWIRNRSLPFYIPATLVEVTIPFSGDQRAFTIRPTTSTSMPPRGEIFKNTLILSVQGTDMKPLQVRG